MAFFMVNAEHEVIVGVSDVIYTSFTNRFVPATDEQVAAYERLAASLPENFYVELSDIIKSEQVTQNPATPIKQRTQAQQSLIDQIRKHKGKRND